MKTKWLVADVTALESPGRGECAILGVILAERFFANSGRICRLGATLRCRTPLLSRNNFTQGHLMKIKWLVTNVTAVGSPGRAERAILRVILAGRCFGQFRPYLWSGSHIVMYEPPLEL